MRPKWAMGTLTCSPYHCGSFSITGEKSMFHFNPAAIVGVTDYKGSLRTSKQYAAQEAEPDWEALLPSAERLLHKAKSMLAEETDRIPYTFTIERPWLTPQEAADYLGCSKAFLDKDRVTGLHGIPFGYLGRNIRYNVNDLDDFLKQNNRKG